MKLLLLSSALMVSLGGCLMPSGINPNLGCSPITGCTSKDYYLPGRGVWAPKPMSGTKATIGALIGAGVGALAGSQMGNGAGKLVATAAGSVTGLVLGHSVGTTFDKMDHMFGTMALKQSLDNNPDGVYNTWKNPKKPVTVTAGPIATNGNCREFITDVQVGKEMRNIRGTACKVNGEWELKEMNK